MSTTQNKGLLKTFFFFSSFYYQLKALYMRKENKCLTISLSIIKA
nr:MAG TPA: hypothetical protein [Myoviridae sp. ct5lt7]